MNLTLFDLGLGAELWKTDGTAAGTVLVKDIHPTDSSVPQSLEALGALLFFSADDGAAGRELWRSDGSGSGTVRVADLGAGPAGSAPDLLRAAGGALYFTADDGLAGRELWIFAP